MKLLTSSSVLVISALALASLAPQPTMAADSCGSGACLTNYDPVCGSDGKTYSNACELSRAKCTNTSLTQKSTGECSSTGSSSTGGTAVCAQEFACTSKYDPVCGSDGKTYANACELKRATCANPAVVLKSTGECFSSSSDSSASGSTGGGGATVCKIKGCTKEYKPVCGSDNKTYANKCTFTNAQCETPALTLKAEVACEGDDVDDSDGSSSVGRDAQVSSGSSDDDACVTMCTKESEPVCGSNGLTYENACLLKNAQCSNATLSKASDSACPTVAPATGSAATATTAVGIQVAALAVLSAIASLML